MSFFSCIFVCGSNNTVQGLNPGETITETPVRRVRGQDPVGQPRLAVRHSSIAAIAQSHIPVLHLGRVPLQGQAEGDGSRLPRVGAVYLATRTIGNRRLSSAAETAASPVAARAFHGKELSSLSVSIHMSPSERKRNIAEQREPSVIGDESQSSSRQESQVPANPDSQHQFPPHSGVREEAKVPRLVGLASSREDIPAVDIGVRHDDVALDLGVTSPRAIHITSVDNEASGGMSPLLLAAMGIATNKN